MITARLAGKRIAVTGSTGFLGTAIVERLLRQVPDCELALLVRPGRRGALDRIRREVLKNDAFDRLRRETGDSKTFDETPWAGQCDLVFVDGSHARSYVESDSQKALRLVKPGGLVLWHDYRGHKLRGVFDTLNQLARTMPLVHIHGTSIVAYRRPPLGA